MTLDRKGNPIRRSATFWIVLILTPSIVSIISRAGPEAVPSFRDIAAQSSFAYVTNNHFTGRKYFPQPMCGGVAIFDFDGDGLMDIYFTNGADLPSNQKTDKRYWNVLLRNLGDDRFEDVTERAGLTGVGLGYNFGVAAADFDNDGHTDLFLVGMGRNALMRNQGDGSFKDVTVESGLGSRPLTVLSVGAAWLDYDKDGLLDLVVSNYTQWTPHTDIVCRYDSSNEMYCSPTVYDSVPHQLFRNLGQGRFADVSATAGFADAKGKGMGIAIADFNQDGWDDIFVANDTVRNFLYLNQKDGTFEEAGLLLGVAYNDDGIPVSSMGCDARDYNNDGYVDVFYNNLPGQIHALFRNAGGDFFEYVSPPTRIADLSRRFAGWSNGFIDYNNDGWKDIYSANGDVDNLRAGSAQHDTLFHNIDGATFRDASSEMGRDFVRVGFQRGSAFGDLNNDGRMDLVVTTLGERPRILLNQGATETHWLLVDPRGHKSNRDAIGARLKLTLPSG